VVGVLGKRKLRKYRVEREEGGERELCESGMLERVEMSGF
jgi:hypothetical protein